MSSARVPLISVEGTARECGVQLGQTWRDVLKLHASKPGQPGKPWWKAKRHARLIGRLAPHLPDLYAGMAQGAGLEEDDVCTAEPGWSDGCTSFAVAPRATLDGEPISGQTKDTHADRRVRYRVLRMRISDAPSMLTLTYPGWLFGHGFVEGGCAIFGNSLYAGQPQGELPNAAWGLLALHCRTVEHVVEMTRRYGCRGSGHRTVADTHGGIVGIEMWAKGPGFLKPKRGMYTHANAVVSSKRWKSYETMEFGTRENSLAREARLRELLEPDRGRLTAQLAYAALTDHEGYPCSICRHENERAMTTAVVIVEPTRKLMHVTRGAPDRHFPATYSL
jgi:isopenicillin-N N-acyltransferase-like protein